VLDIESVLLSVLDSVLLTILVSVLLSVLETVSLSVLLLVTLSVALLVVELFELLLEGVVAVFVDVSLLLGFVVTMVELPWSVVVVLVEGVDVMTVVVVELFVCPPWQMLGIPGNGGRPCGGAHVSPAGQSLGDEQNWTLAPVHAGWHVADPPKPTISPQQTSPPVQFDDPVQACVTPPWQVDPIGMQLKLGIIPWSWVQHVSMLMSHWRKPHVIVVD
jgi:hypothetical protein